ncbi:hypothetical protein DT076_05620 [Desertihabitans brevis]|uniref:Uncharacterized protein n=1 Tax=Desertihabitans brevis TaxID=2268447 RepID=A0A367YWG1_9ACTN|nr:hypothetical protein DT076_05620 [Desertihabitans brevis]
MLDALSSGAPVALGFEAPIVVPVSPVDTSEGWRTLGRARQGETGGGQSRPWSAGAGSGALTTGLVQLAWMLDWLASQMSTLRVTTSPSHWTAGQAELFVWEAFVSGTGKPVPSATGQHAADAAAAADTFADRLAAGTLGTSDVTCGPSSAFNLVAAAAAFAGMSVVPPGLRSDVPVYRTRPGDAGPHR